MYKLKYNKLKYNNYLRVDFSLNIGIYLVLNIVLNIDIYLVFVTFYAMYSSLISYYSCPIPWLLLLFQFLVWISGPVISLMLQTTMSKLDVAQILPNPCFSRKWSLCFSHALSVCSISNSHNQKTFRREIYFTPLHTYHLYQVSLQVLSPKAP